MNEMKFFRAVESAEQDSEKCNCNSTILGILCFSLMIMIGLFFPYFTDVMGIITDFAVSLGVFFLPVIFHWRLNNPGFIEKMWMVFVLLFGVVGSVVGIVVTAIDLYHNILDHPLGEFFEEIFAVNKTKCSI